jgi:hypothetical protein
VFKSGFVLFFTHEIDSLTYGHHVYMTIQYVDSVCKNMNVLISWMPVSHVVWVLEVTMYVSIDGRIMDSTWEQARVEITTLVDVINHRKMGILSESIFVEFVLLFCSLYGFKLKSNVSICIQERHCD